VSGTWRRFTPFLAAIVLLGLLWPEPADASPAPPAPRHGAPALSLPVVRHAVPDAAQTAAAVPASRDLLPAPGRRTARDLPTRSHELVAERDAATEVWANVDGTQTVEIHGEPINFRRPGSAAWERIDSSLVPDPERPGWVRNAANDWTVRFGPIVPGGGGGVELVTAAGATRLAPETTGAIQPVVGTGDRADTVTYPGVWPGVDVRYTVSGSRVKEDIVVAGGARASFPFVTEGLGLTQTDAPQVSGPQSDTLRLAPLEVADGNGRFTDAAGARMRVEPLAGRQRLVVSVDGAWLADQASAGPGPVVVDPTVVVGPVKPCSYNNHDFEMCDGVRTGTEYPIDQPLGDFWRGVAQWNYRPYVETQDVLFAGVWMTQGSQGTTNSEVIDIWDASGFSSAGAVHGLAQPIYLIDQAPTSHGGCFGTDVCLDVTEKLHQWQLIGVFKGRWDGKFGFTGDESDPDLLHRYSYKYFDPAHMSLVMNVNRRPPAPALIGPAPNSLAIATTTPTLSWSSVTDADGDTVKYSAQIATGTDGESGLVASSPEGTATSWTVPEGVLQDGVSYYWKVFANDTHYWTPSDVRKITVDRRLGAGGTSPTDTFGGVTTNLVTGNATLTVPAPELPTVGGDIGASFTYNGQQQRRGLVGTYRQDANQNRTIDASDPVKLVRTDAQVSLDWTKWNVTDDGVLTATSTPPTPSMPSDWYSVRWTGFITLPSGFDWQLGARSDDGVRVQVDGATVLDRWVDRSLPAAPDYESGTHPGGTTHRISIDYYESGGGATIQLWAQHSGSAGLIVPADWLSPDNRDMPEGWSLEAAGTDVAYVRAQVADGSVTLIGPDGSTYAFSRNPGGGYRPPEGADDVLTMNGDGRVTVQDGAGATYVFRVDGGLESVTSAADDRRPAAPSSGFDAQGRLTRLTDPVSGRSVTLRYAASDGDTACPNNPPVSGASGFAAVTGLLCRVDYWDGTATEMYYKNGLLGYIRNPGDAYWGFSYDATGRLTGFHDPATYDAAISGARTDWDRLLTEIAYAAPPAGLPAWVASRIVSTVTLPPALQSDTSRPQHTYTLSRTMAGGVLTGGTSTVTRAGAAGTYLSVGYDQRGRTTTSTNALGQTTTTYWNADDEQVGSRGPDGLVTATVYDSRHQPTDEWGPAPESSFDLTSGVPVPKASPATPIPHNQTRYDEGLSGLQVTWWDNIGATGPPVLRQHDDGGVSSQWATGSPGTGVPADNFSGRWTGDITFPTAGTTYLVLGVATDDLAAISIDDDKIADVWAVGAAGNASAPVVTTTPNERHRIRLDYVDIGGDASIRLMWILPGGTLADVVDVPGSALSPGYGLETSTVDPDGMVTETQYADAAAGIGPQHGLPTRTIVDPGTGHLNLTETTAYEPVGSGFLRRVSRTLPAGPATATTSAYYGDAETRDNPCTAAADPANQGGMQKLDTSADPDGSGPQTALVRESVYDAAGRVVAARVGTEPWTCTTYDARGRVTQVAYPAFGGQPARTVTYGYQVDPDGSGPRAVSPLVTSVADPAGTVTTEVDVLGRVISYRDVFGNTTTYTYDLAGRQTASSGPAGTLAQAYDDGDRVTSTSLNGTALASGLAYDAGGRLTAAAYQNGTAGRFDYDAYGRPAKTTWTGPGGVLITSDQVERRSLGGEVLGRIVDGADHHAGDDYVYDAAGRLTQAWVPGRHVTYGYAATGGCGTLTTAGADTDRTSQAIEGGPTTTYCYDGADRLTSSSDASVGAVAYDGHGNTTSIFGETHSYDAADRHLATTKGVTGVTYVRDATDRIVERRLNGVTVARYGSAGPGDAPDFTTDAANTVLEATLALPGGSLLTTRPTGNVWSYSDTHGDVVATASQAGVKQGPTVTYDPFGGVVGGMLPDNSAGGLDYDWLGQHRRPLEHEDGLQPVVEMGARQYSPLLGRFLEVDPVEGGSANDYDYVSGDPVDDEDLDGTCRTHHHGWWGHVRSFRCRASHAFGQFRQWGGRLFHHIGSGFRRFGHMVRHWWKKTRGAREWLVRKAYGCFTGALKFTGVFYGSRLLLLAIARGALVVKDAVPPAAAVIAAGGCLLGGYRNWRL